MLRPRMLYHSEPDPMSHAVDISYLINLISFVSQIMLAELFHNFNHQSFLSACLVPTLTHSNSFTSHLTLGPFSRG